jgi:hypothetical protein
MTMREIQDLTIDRLRGADRLNARLARLAETFNHATRKKFFLQLAAAPTTAKISLPWNTDPALILPTTRSFSSQDGKHTFSLPNQGVNGPRPILRGWRWVDQWVQPQLLVDVYWDGSVVVQFEVRDDETNWTLDPELVVALAGNALLEVDRVRKLGGQPDAEYAVKFQIATQTALQVMNYGGGVLRIGRPVHIHTSLSPPVYVVSSSDTFSGFIDDIQRDLFNAAGVTADDINIEI